MKLKNSFHLLAGITSMCLLCQMAFLTACRQSGNAQHQVDSTMVKKIEAMQDRGSEYRNKSDFEAAIAIHDSCIKLAEQIEDTTQLIIALNNQGTNFRRLSAMKEAADYHYRALTLCDAYSDTSSWQAKKNLVRTLNGLGNLLSSLENHEAAENMFRRALHGEEQLESATGQAINLANIGSIKRDVGETDSARYYFNESMKKNREDNNFIGISLCYTYLGELDQREGHMAEALQNFRMAYIIGRKTNDTWHWLTPCISLANIYVDYNQTDSAFQYINLGINAAQAINSNEHLYKLYALRSRLEDQQGQTALAFADLKLSKQYNDSVLTQESSSYIQNTRVNYETNRRNMDVKRAEEEAEMSRTIRNIVIIAAILIFILIGISGIMTQRASQARRKAQKERELFYRSVTHQLRTPMTVVLGMVNQLQDHISPDDKIGIESLEAAQRQSKNLLDLIKQLISASKDGTLLEMSDIAPIKSKDAKTVDTLNKAITETKKSASQISVHPDELPSNVSSIVVAEDNDDVAMLICTLLRNNGYYVTRASDGQEALDMLQNELPDLLLTDIAMPRMDGLELMRHVREDDTMCHLPIIVASARVEDSERMEGINAGAEVYLTKPFIPEELLLRVRKILEQRKRLRELFTQNISTAEEAHKDMPADEQDFLKSLNVLIDENMLSGEINSATLAKALYMSQSTFNRKIKNITGLSSSAYCRSRRLLVAKNLLETTNKSVNEIETLCGFNTPGHFSRLFKTETGMSPSEYRTNLLKHKK